MQAFFLLVAGEVLEVVQEVGDGSAMSATMPCVSNLQGPVHSLVVVIDPVSQRVALRVLLLPRLVDGCDDGARL
jgi:hypothetical protein